LIWVKCSTAIGVNGPIPTIAAPARLAAVAERLDTISQAVKMVCSGLDGFHGALNDEQKARSDAIGPQMSPAEERPDPCAPQTRS
jgi:LTXXQ motif family protein